MDLLKGFPYENKNMFHSSHFHNPDINGVPHEHDDKSKTGRIH